MLLAELIAPIVPASPSGLTVGVSNGIVINEERGDTWSTCACCKSSAAMPSDAKLDSAILRSSRNSRHTGAAGWWLAVRKVLLVRKVQLLRRDSGAGPEVGPGGPEGPVVRSVLWSGRLRS